MDFCKGQAIENGFEQSVFNKLFQPVNFLIIWVSSIFQLAS